MKEKRKIVCICYADAKYEKAQQLNLDTARRVGKADRVIAYGPADIDEKFYREHQDILSQARGNGYWLWKPYFIYRTLLEISDGDVLVYADSGSYYLRPVKYLVKAMEAANVDVMPFELEYNESRYSKRDAFVLMECDTPEYAQSKQRQGTFQVIRKNSNSLAFVKEWLDYSCNKQIISDTPSQLGEEYPDFVENRHDQTIFSLLSKKYRLPAFRDPSQFGNDRVYSNSPYPQIWELHRNGKMDAAQARTIRQAEKKRQIIENTKKILGKWGILEPVLKVKRIFIPKK